jgi:hypothetical protein
MERIPKDGLGIGLVDFRIRDMERQAQKKGKRAPCSNGEIVVGGRRISRDSNPKLYDAVMEKIKNGD